MQTDTGPPEKYSGDVSRNPGMRSDRKIPGITGHMPLKNNLDSDSIPLAKENFKGARTTRIRCSSRLSLYESRICMSKNPVLSINYSMHPVRLL